VESFRAFFSIRDLGDYLDVACGEGEFTERLLETAKGYRSALGIDTDEESLATARELFEGHFGNVFFDSEDAHSLSMPAASFDTVSISNALHHVVDPQRVLSELRRVLRPGGILVVNEMISDVLSPEQENARDLHHFKARIDRSQGLEHRETYSEDRLRELLGLAPVVPSAEVAGSSRPAVLLDLTEHPEADDPELRERRIEFLESYAEIVEGSDLYPTIRKEALRLKYRISSGGFSPQPQKVYVLSWG
jgi:ubiquinone/menaquinone biosynthesis C-methylase UbiE